MMAALLHWSQGNWLALAGDMRAMGLLKPTTDLQELAHDLQDRFTQLYAASTQQQQKQQQQQRGPAVAVDPGLEPHLNSSSSSSSTTFSHSSTQRATTAAASVTDAASRSGQPSLLLQAAGAIGFAEFAGVIAALALKYRFELPPYYTLVIRSLTTLEGFALLVEPSARQNIAQTAVKVGSLHTKYSQVVMST
jgi:predicted unusual protein kinase regulating ubiquinone biosynthesis (AarF/ABC1/UbiB family)